MILVIETLAIRNALKQGIQENSKVIIKSDSLISIQAISGKSILPIHFCNLVEDTNRLAEKNHFVFCRRSADMIAEKTCHACITKDYYQ